MIIDFTLTNNQVTEGIENGYVIGDFIVNNSNLDAIHTFKLIDDDGIFDIINNQLIVRDTTRIDYETTTLHNLIILVTDNNEYQLQKTFEIIVLDNVLNAIIDYIEPLNTKIGTKPEIKIIGRNFSEGGSPVVRIMKLDL
jgi:hypothetical protein